MLDSTQEDVIILKRLIGKVSQSLNGLNLKWEYIFEQIKNQKGTIDGLLKSMNFVYNKLSPGWFNQLLNYCPLRGLIFGGGGGAVAGTLIPGLDVETGARVGLVGSAAMNLLKQHLFSSLPQDSWSRWGLELFGKDEGWLKALWDSGLLTAVAFPKQAMDLCGSLSSALYSGAEYAWNGMSQAASWAKKALWDNHNQGEDTSLNTDAQDPAYEHDSRYTNTINAQDKVKKPIFKVERVPHSNSNDTETIPSSGYALRERKDKITYNENQLSRQNRYKF